MQIDFVCLLCVVDLLARGDANVKRIIPYMRLSSISSALFASLVLTLLAHVSARAGEASAPAVTDKPTSPQIQLFIENDVLAGSDRYYTNGIKIGGGGELALIEDLLTPIPESILNALAKKAPDGSVPRNNFGFFIGQNLYTPRNISIADNQPNDRPWAAWLYFGGVLQRVQGNRLDTAELDIGMVGPAALGRPIQSGWHHLVGAQQPKGWSNQASNELAFMAAYLQKRRFGNSTIQIVPHAGLTLGTAMTLARVGGIVRIGNRMTGFGPDSIEPGGAMLQTTRAQDQATTGACCEWYLFAGGDYRLVARNIFLDGPMFSDGPNVNHRNVVHDATAGFAMRYRQLNLSLTHIRRSEEFTTVFGGGGRQAFYSLNLGWQFE